MKDSDIAEKKVREAANRHVSLRCEYHVAKQWKHFLGFAKNFSKGLAYLSVTLRKDLKSLKYPAFVIALRMHCVLKMQPTSLL